MRRTALRGGPSTSAPSDGSRTITLLDSQPHEEGDDNANGEEAGSLNLVGGGRSRPRVVWSEDVVDNEGTGRKSSKICCIYHKPRKFDESSSEESSDSDSGSDSDCNHNHPHTHGPRRRHAHRDGPSPPSNGSDSNTRSREGGGEAIVHSIEDEDSDTNKYERAPMKPKKGKGVARNEA